MFFRSIHWNIQIWYGVILSITLASLLIGFYSYRSESSISELDSDLAAILHPVTAQFFDGTGSPLKPEAISVQRILAGHEARGLYFAVWDREGKELYRSSTAPISLRADPRLLPLPKAGLKPSGNTASSGWPLPAKGTAHWREGNRELSLAGNSGVVLSGKLSSVIRSDRAAFTWKLLSIGGSLCALALLCGWWVSKRALRPLTKLSVAANAIAAGSLSERLPLVPSDKELNQLARVLNGCFDRLEGFLRQQARFTADASHELRTPLTVIHAEAQAALMENPSKEELMEAFQICQESTQHMRDLITKMLDLARIDSGESSLEREFHDLAEVVRDALELMRTMVEKKGVILSFHEAPANCYIDQERIRGVIFNIISNAIQYTPSGRFIDVVVKQAEKGVLFQVTDEGEGIASEDLPYVFERFYRTDKARSRDRGGSGLGLAIAKAIVEKHDGRIEIASSLSRGTTVTVQLPCMA